MTTTSRYHYKPLPDDGHSIRLLRLLPSANSAAKVECHIFHARIGDPSQAHYEALSYTWGDAAQKVDIGLSGSVFPATVNLEAALRALRRPDQPRVLWVDAVCINQDDLQEQGAQVRMMWDIYKAADCVVIWLGPGNGDTAVAMDNMAKKNCQTKLAVRQTMRERPADERDPTWCGCRAGDFATHPSKIGVQSLLNSRWFTRVWVLQEVAAAKRVTVACGDRTVDGEDFYAEIISLSSWYLSLQKTLRKSRPALELMNHAATGLSAGSLPLLELMESFRGWDATKQVDKLFALLNFASDAPHATELRPDYAVPAPELAHRIVRFALPTAVIDQQSDQDSTEVTFEIRGLLLGEIHMKMRDTEREFHFYAGRSKLPEDMAVMNPKAAEMFGPDARWNIEIANERRLELGSAVFLLQGATRPTVLSLRKGELAVDVLAAPEPAKTGPDSRSRMKAWPSVLSALSGETEGLVTLRLSWDPFRKPLPSEVSRYAPTPNHPVIQWEAMVESLRDEAEKGAGGEEHNCKTMVALKMMMDYDADAIKAGTSQYTMTLHKAAYGGLYGTTKLLLDANADANEPLDALDGATPLHCAAHGGHVHVARALLDAGAKADAEDASGITPLDIALSRRNIDLANLLIQAGAPVRLASTSEAPEDRLFDLAIGGNAEELRALLSSSGVDPDHKKEMGGIGGVTALHLAAEMGRKEVVAALLEAGANPDAGTAEDTTPLHQAAMNGHVEVIELLLGVGADVNARDVRGATPLAFALYREKAAAAQVITKAGGRVEDLDVEESSRGCCGCVCS